MRIRHPLILFVVLLTALVITPLPSHADSDRESGSGKSREIIVRRDAAEQFIVLPDGVRFPEGITANPQNGELYVSTFDSANPVLLRFDRRGHLLAVRSFSGPLLGLEFNQSDNKVYVCNFGASRIQRIAANFTRSTLIEDVADVPPIGAPPDLLVPNPDGSEDKITFGNKFPAPNAFAFNKTGSLFFSDSFQGAIFKIDNPTTCGTPHAVCPVSTVKQDGRLATTGFPPFGANGLAFSSDDHTLFIANTGDDRVLRMDMTSNAKTITTFAESINGADGLTFDRSGRLWVCANQADEIVGLSPTGRVIAKLGDFLGINKDLTPRGLLFPASNVIVGNDMFVTNLAIPLTGGDEPEADVRRWTISRIRLPGLDDD